MDGLQLDLATVILRIEQAYADPELREFLLFRLATCDAPRLRRHLDAGTLAEMADSVTGSSSGADCGP